jgi:PAS domain-containing protein
LEGELTLDAYVDKFHPDDRAYVVESINAAIYEDKPYSIDYRIIPRPDDVRHIHAEGELTHGEKGLPIMFYGTVQDITEWKRAEEALGVSEARLRLALDSSDAGMWEWDLRTNRNLWSEELWRLYGLKPHSCEPSYDSWRATIHPDDRKMAEKTVQEAVGNGTAISLEYRVPEDLPSFSKDLYLS